MRLQATNGLSSQLTRLTAEDSRQTHQSRQFAPLANDQPWAEHEIRSGRCFTRSMIITYLSHFNVASYSPGKCAKVPHPSIGGNEFVWRLTPVFVAIPTGCASTISDSDARTSAPPNITCKPRVMYSHRAFSTYLFPRPFSLRLASYKI
jgi:hypothetical protein